MNVFCSCKTHSSRSFWLCQKDHGSLCVAIDKGYSILYIGSMESLFRQFGAKVAPAGYICSSHNIRFDICRTYDITILELFRNFSF